MISLRQCCCLYDVSIVLIAIVFSLVFSSLLFARTASATVFLQYHHISNQTPASTSISPKLFQQHLDLIEAEKFQVVGLPQFIKAHKEKRNLPDKTVVITFDDAYESVFKEAFPRLKKKGYPFTVFVHTQPIEQGLKGFANWQQLAQMHQYGATIANHSKSHNHLIRRKAGESSDEWSQRIQLELAEAQGLILRRVGDETKAFAYPYGEYDEALLRLVKSQGYMGFGQQSGAANKDSAFSLIPRFPMTDSFGKMEQFKVKLSSLALSPLELQLVDDKNQVLTDHILPHATDRVGLILRLNQNQLGLDINCYQSGPALMKRKQLNGGYLFEPITPLPVGRSRLNCTAKELSGSRFYWFSQQLFRKAAGDAWYQE